MIWVVLVLLVAVAAAAAGVGALAVSARRKYAAANQIVPGSPSAAPAEWAGAHSPQAKLHRRLVAATAAARAANSSATALATVQATALAIDDRLIAAAALPAAHRDSAVAQVAPFVARLEATVAELGSITAGADSVDARLTETQRCITALQESHRELDALP